MTPFECMITVLAAWEIVEIWHHGDIFAERRAKIELWNNGLKDLLLCPFCFSVWVGWLTAGWFYLAQRTGHPGLALVLYGFAIARTANLLNDLTRNRCRTPNRSEDS